MAETCKQCGGQGGKQVVIVDKTGKQIGGPVGAPCSGCGKMAPPTFVTE